jgi:ParB/RepB/Spo0J family partition protein
VPTVITRPVDFFHPDPSNPRKDFPEEELQLLGESLKKKQLVPLIARNSGMVVDGERRWRAAKLAGVKCLDVVLIDDSATEAQVREIQIITSLHKVGLRPYELLGGCKSWLALHPGVTIRELALAISRSESSLVKILSLDRCIEPVRAAAAEGRLGVSDWYAMSRLSAADQAALLSARLRGEITSRDELESRSRQARNGGKPAVRVSRVRCAMPSGVTVTLAGNGEGITLADVIETLTDLLKAARKANDDGLDSKTFSAVMRDRSKAG